MTPPSMTTLSDAAALAAADNGLAVVATLRADQTIQSSLINAGVVTHPATGEPALAFVTYGRVKLANLRSRPQTAVTFRTAGVGRQSRAAPNSPVPTIRNHG